LRDPQRDTVLYPAVSYPTYAMGALLAGCRAVPIAVDEGWHLDLSSVDDADARRALCLWANTPANPTGAVDDLGAAAEWGRGRGGRGARVPGRVLRSRRRGSRARGRRAARRPPGAGGGPDRRSRLGL